MAALLVLPDLKRCSMLSHLGKRSGKSGKRCQVTKAIESLQTNAATWHHWTRVSIGEYSEFEYTVSSYSEKVWCSNVPMPFMAQSLLRHCYAGSAWSWDFAFGRRKGPTNSARLCWQLLESRCSRCSSLSPVIPVTLPTLQQGCQNAGRKGQSLAAKLWSRCCSCWASAVLQDIPAGNAQRRVGNQWLPSDRPAENHSSGQGPSL